MNDQPGTPRGPSTVEASGRPKLSAPSSIILMITVAGISGLFCLSPSGLLSSTLATALFAVLLLLAKRPLALLTVPLSYLAALLFFSSPIGAIAALGYVPAGTALAISIAKRKRCASAVFWVTLLSLVTAGIFLGAYLLSTYGSLTGGFMKMYALIEENTRASLAALITDQTLPQSLQSTYQESLLLLEESFRLTLYLLPGLAVSTFFFLSWIAAKLAKRFLRAFRAERYFFRKYWRIYVAAWWAKLFIALTVFSMVLSFFEGKTADILYYIIANLLLVFEPPVMMVGVRRLFTLLRKLRKSGALPIYFAACTLFVLCLCCSASYLLVGLTYVGAFHSIAKGKRKKLAEAEKTEEDASEKSENETPDGQKSEAPAETPPSDGNDENHNGN